MIPSTGLLKLDPPTALIFVGPFNRKIPRTLKITNPSDTETVWFKMKTTAPTLFFVRPNMDKIEPGETISVQINLQPIEKDQLEVTCNYKFLIQAVTGIKGFQNTSVFWNRISPADIWNAKLKCILIQDNNVIEETTSDNLEITENNNEDTTDIAEVEDLRGKIDILKEQKSKLTKELEGMAEVKMQLEVQSQNLTQGRYFGMSIVLYLFAAFVGYVAGKYYL